MGECMSEETALMALRPPKGSKNTTEWFDRWGVKMCRDNEGLEFACGDGECCGQVCKAEGDLCCKNDLGDAFPCQAGGECCGNACAAPGSKCCNKGKPGYEYPVAEGTACTSDSVTCINSNGNEFQCGAGSTCCGDICSGPGGVCCKGSSSNFLCGPHSSCCGDLCAGAGGVCCQNEEGYDFVCGAGSRCGKNVCLADH